MISARISLLLTVILTVSAQILIKKAAPRIITRQGFGILLRSCLQPAFFAGGFFTLVAPWFYFKALSRIPLSRAFMVNGLSYLAVVWIGSKILKEDINRYHRIGCLFILAGFIVWGGGMA